MGESDDRPSRMSDAPDALHAEFDWDVTSPSVAVVQTVAIAAGREATELSPLIGALDPDALDQLYTTGPDGDVSLSFQLDGYAVTVTGDGDVYVRTERVSP
jgi:hypothetical protein